MVGRLVGMLTGGTTTLNPCGGAGATSLGSLGRFTTLGVGAFGFGGGFGNSFFGGGGSSFLTATKLTFVSRVFSAFRAPARAVAKIARKRMVRCNTMLN